MRNRQLGQMKAESLVRVIQLNEQVSARVVDLLAD
jgi:hypothetical protein